jgi:hypothetical protein
LFGGLVVGLLGGSGSGEWVGSKCVFVFRGGVWDLALSCEETCMLGWGLNIWLFQNLEGFKFQASLESRDFVSGKGQDWLEG